MADRGRVGSLVVSSRSCAEKVWRKNHNEHAKRLMRVKPVVDISGPKGVDHIHNNLKRERLLETRYQEIDLENKQLLRKMSEIMKKPCDYLKLQQNQKPKTLNFTGRKKELLEITKENQRLLRSIQSAQPVYSSARWDEDWQRSERLVRNCSQYPVITRMSRNKSAPNMFMSLPPEQQSQASAPASPAATQAQQAGLQDGEPDAGQQQLPQQPFDDGPGEFIGGEGEMAEHPSQEKLLVKDGRRIGEAYYLVEMSTEGRTLHISAYNGETQTSLELIVKEKVHRKLFRECEGDYSALVSRLRIAGNRLVLDEADGKDAGV
mmetsp:Transcript_19686/g.45940  ORF Transcript_19686/g.45940 Transcript_19686/m.45940 type:complete len:320 (+) Transcript_19686:125-1084(+)